VERWSDVTDTWDSSPAAGSRAPAEREANLNANQELKRHDARRAARKRISSADASAREFDRFPRRRPSRREEGEGYCPIRVIESRANRHREEKERIGLIGEDFSARSPLLILSQIN